SASVLLSKSGLSRLVDRMVEAGLVRRERCEDDRRGWVAVLTDQGRSALRRAAPVHLRGIQEHFVRHLEPEEVQVLSTALARVVAAARAAGADQPEPPEQMEPPAPLAARLARPPPLTLLTAEAGSVPGTQTIWSDRRTHEQGQGHQAARGGTHPAPGDPRRPPARAGGVDLRNRRRAVELRPAPRRQRHRDLRDGEERLAPGAGGVRADRDRRRLPAPGARRLRQVPGLRPPHRGRAAGGDAGHPLLRRGPGEGRTRGRVSRLAQLTGWG